MEVVMKEEAKDDRSEDWHSQVSGVAHVMDIGPRRDFTLMVWFFGYVKATISYHRLYRIRLGDRLLERMYALTEESMEDTNKFGNETQLLAKVVQKLAVIRALDEGLNLSKFLWRFCGHLFFTDDVQMLAELYHFIAVKEDMPTTSHHHVEHDWDKLFTTRNGWGVLPTCLPTFQLLTPSCAGTRWDHYEQARLGCPNATEFSWRWSSRHFRLPRHYPGMLRCPPTCPHMSQW